MKRMINKINNYNNIIILLVLLIITFMTVGYSYYSKLLNFGGSVTVKPDGKLVITNISVVESSNVIRENLPEINGTTIEFDVGFGGSESEFYIEYQMDAINNSSYDYTFNEFDFNPVVHASGGGTGDLYLSLDGIEAGDVVRSGMTRTFKLRLTLVPSDPTQNYDASGTTEPTVDTSPTGQILVVASPTSINLQGDNDLIPIEIEVLNTYSYDINFKAVSGNGNFLLKDKNGDNLESMILPANTDSNKYTVYVKKIDDAIFETNSSTTVITLDCGKLGLISSNTIQVAVDIYVAPDTEPPHIGIVTLSPSTTDAGNATVSWSRTDTGGTDVVGYHVLIYKSGNSTALKDIETDGNTYTYSFDDLYSDSYTDGDYYAIVYGIDKKNNGVDYLSQASGNNEYCRMSSNVTFDWIFDVTHNTGNFTYRGESTAVLGSSYEATITATGNYSINTVTINMNNSPLQSGYTKSGNTWTITKVTGPISFNITTSGSCLVEGTKIKLANGNEKNIEDIKYDDLLLVWNYETGSIGYEYPVWIEQYKISDKYQETIFEDGTILNTVMEHAVFSVDKNMFVNVNDKDDFHVGTTVLKKDDNNKLVKTKVKSINIVNKTVKYYFVASTRYFNVFANDILTVGSLNVWSNQYGFDNNYKWIAYNEIRNNYLENVYPYEVLDGIPYYLYYGLRAGEGKYAVNKGYISDRELSIFLKENIANKDMIVSPNTDYYGNRVWRVTTSNDIMYSFGGKLYKEGAIYILPKAINKYGKKFIGWYNMADGKIYREGSLVRIYCGTHFEAIYE